MRPALRLARRSCLMIRCCLLYCLLDLLRSADGAGHTVFLTDGSPLRGFESRGANGRSVVQFLGVPFAEPPVGRLRFRKPVAAKPWREVLNASRLPNACVQNEDTYFGDFAGADMWNPNTAVSEDCLYLNMYVPGAWDHGRKLPVMVWIYGGGFWSGSASLAVYDGNIFASEEDVLIVSINYRVSVFGFLYLDREEAPGNVGLWDQLLALKWVRKNIGKFGGDAGKVTIFGESAGGASVSMHVLSAQSAPYFERAIMQSGSASAPWAVEPRQVLVRRAVHLCQAMKCGNMTLIDESSWHIETILACLLDASVASLKKYEWAPVGEFGDFPWVPVIDGDFFTEDVLVSLKNGHFKKSQILVGSNLDEAIYFIVYSLQDVFDKPTFFSRDDFIQSDSVWYRSAYKLLPHPFRKNALVRDAIFHEYYPWGLPASPAARIDAIDKLMGDYMFTCNVNEFAQYYAAHGGSAYYYYFTHRATTQSWPRWMGVLHGYEINFIFGEPLNTLNYSYTDDERALSRRFMRYWANFARTGNPNQNPDGTWGPVYWPMYTGQTQEYLTLSVDSQAVGHGPRRRQCAFWKHYVPTLYTATANTTDALLRWKQQFHMWQSEYITDWKYQFELYKQTQHTYQRRDASCGG